MNTAIDEDWRLLAACRGHDPEMWSLSVGRSGSAYNEAHKICDGCPVRVPCADMAERTGSWGLIFGGRDFYLPKPAASREWRNCVRCNKSFHTPLGWRRFCTDTCRKLHHAKRPPWTN